VEIATQRLRATDLIDSEQFAEACTLWTAQKDVHL
jgi:hypothetical protein